MIKLETFFNNPFDTNRVSDDNIDLFAQDHLARLKTNNPNHLYDSLITTTETVYQTYYSSKVNESVQLAKRKAATINVNNYSTEFIQLASQKEGFIRAIWGKDSAEYQEFYPLGRKEYHRINRANSSELMERYLHTANKHKENLPAGFVDAFATIISAYQDSRRDQLRLMGNISGSKNKTAETRQLLEKQIMYNLHIIASENIGNPKIVKVYFTQNYVENNKNRAHNESMLSGSIEPEQTLKLWYDKFETTSEFTISNTGKTRLQFYTAQLTTDPPPESCFELSAGETTTAFAFELGEADNPYLMVHNPNVEVTGSYKIKQ